MSLLTLAVNLYEDVKSPYRRYAKRRKLKKDKESLTSNVCACLNWKATITTLCKDGRLGQRKRARVKELGTKHIRVVGVLMSEALLTIN